MLSVQPRNIIVGEILILLTYIAPNPAWRGEMLAYFSLQFFSHILPPPTFAFRFTWPLFVTVFPALGDFNYLFADV
jgi:hypothetical protein